MNYKDRKLQLEAAGVVLEKRPVYWWFKAKQLDGEWKYFGPYMSEGQAVYQAERRFLGRKGGFRTKDKV